MGKKANPTVIGLFVVGALVLAVAGVLVFGSGQFFKRTNKFVMFFPGSVNGLSVGAAVKFKGVDIGRVTDIRLVAHRGEEIEQSLSIPIYVETDPTKISVDNERLEMGSRENVKLLVEHGMRAQLQAQSLVTGLLFVQIDFFPGTPVKYVLPQPSTPVEVPTVPTTLEQASSAAREIIDELRNIKFGPMVQDASEAIENLNTLLSAPALRKTIDALPDTVSNVNETVTSLRRLSDDVRGHVDPLVSRVDSTLAGADQAFTTVRETAGTANTILEPGSPLDHDLRAALRDAAAAARALARLADMLEQNPAALLYGRPPQLQEKP